LSYRVARFRVRAAFRAAALRCERGRRRAAARANRDNAFRDAVLCGACFNARRAARERFAEGRLARRLDLLDAFFFADLPFAGIRTPARRAFDNPIAIACFVDCAPCLPSRT
jgi:hypothetical protein